MGSSHLFTENQKQFLIDNVKGITAKALTELVNGEFGLSLKESQVKAFKARHKLPSGLSGCFPKGHVPVNKGRKYPGRTSSTSFKKNIAPHNTLPIGTEILRDDSYLWVKIAEPNVWRQKSFLVWEATYGEIPKDHVIVFADQNRLNFDLDNLVLISRKELFICNQKRFLVANDQLSKAGILVSKVIAKSRERRR